MAQRSWKENLCQLVLCPAVLSSLEGQLAEACTCPLPFGGQWECGSQLYKLIEHLLCARHCAEDFLNLIFVKIINVHSIRS